MAEKKKFYAVVRGRKPGIYAAWFGADGAEAQVKGFVGALYRGFATRAAAEAYFESGGAVVLESGGKDSAGAGRLTKDAPLPHEEDLRAGRTVLFTDGACTGNPGPGGYGVVLLKGQAENEDGNRRELSGGFARTTNNRMELFAVIVGLEAIVDGGEVALYSDSRYVVDALEKGWARRWRANGWMRDSKGNRAENTDLWARLLAAMERHTVTLHWVRGHANHPENERCDRLAVRAASQRGLPEDTGMGTSRSQAGGQMGLF